MMIKPMPVNDLSLHSDYWHSTNMVGVPSAILASTEFNSHPVPLHIAGARDSATSLFETLNTQTDPIHCGHIFQDYMDVIFGFDSEQTLSIDAHGRRRYRNSYLKLIQDWGRDANNAQGAVFKGWVESRFGLFPTYHKQALKTIFDRPWLHYIEEKMNSRYHNNCIYMQLDLLYEFCQWFIARFAIPAKTHKTLFRGVNSLEEYCLDNNQGRHHKQLRFNNLLSFTDQIDIAGQFGSYILKIDVPMVKLVFFNDLLPHHALHGEAEYLAIGGDYQVTVL